MPTRYQYTEDMFADTRMTFGEHLEDLRAHLIRALYGFLVGIIISFFIGWYVVDFIKSPVEEALRQYHIKYYKEHGNTAGNAIVAELDRQMAADPDNPAWEKLKRPVKMPFQVPAESLDQWLRTTYPEIYKNAPPLPEGATPLTGTSTATGRDILGQFDDPITILAKRASLTTLSAQEAFMAYFKVSILTGLVISSPWVFYHLWSFVAAGLYPHEKRYIHVYLPFSIFLFLGGVAICELWVIPAALNGLLYFNDMLNLEPDFRFSEWLGFAIWMPVIAGLCFQTPLVMLFLGKIGIFTADQFKSKRKIAIFVMLILAAILSPSVDYFSLLLLWLPMVGLYELGIFLVRSADRRRELEDVEVPYFPEDAGAAPDGYNGEPRREQP